MPIYVSALEIALLNGSEESDDFDLDLLLDYGLKLLNINNATSIPTSSLNAQNISHIYQDSLDSIIKCLQSALLTQKNQLVKFKNF